MLPRIADIRSIHNKILGEIFTATPTVKLLGTRSVSTARRWSLAKAGLRKLRDQGSLADGMLPKAKAIEAALEGNVRRVHMISFNEPDSLLLEVFTSEGRGTLVVKHTEELSPEERNLDASG